MPRFAATIAALAAMLIVIVAPDRAAAQSPAPQAQAFAESHWSGDGPWPETGDWTLYFRSDGVLVYSTGGAPSENGSWRQRDMLVTFQTDDYGLVFAGFVRGDVLEGVSYSSDGQQAARTFHRRASNVAEFCPQNMVALRGTAAPLVCICPQDIALATVWGDEAAYTDDSHICTAAIHAGVITAQAGGRVTITPRPGRASYPGSTMNGVTTLPYGSWQASYTVSAARTAKAK